MAELAPGAPGRRPPRIPFYRDVRVLGVLAQIGFVVLFVAAAGWFLSNIADNLDKLGGSQFICRDGTSSFRCFFDFLSLESQFPIAETPIEYDPSDSYARAIGVGLLNTVKVSVLGIFLATVLGTLAGIARLSQNWLLRNLAGWYIDIMRNTPLVLQLFFIYFSVLLVLPPIREAIQLLGGPIYLSQRGINLPSLVFTSSFTTWAAFVVLGIIQAQVLWLLLGRREEKTGKPTNRATWAFLSFLLIAGIGWRVATTYANDQGILVAKAARVRELEDVATLMENRLQVDDLSDVEEMVAGGALTAAAVDEAALSLCVLENAPSEANLTAQLRRANVPYRVERFERPDQATAAYAAGECEVYAADRATLAAERELLEDGAGHFIVPIAATPARLSVPRLEGLNFVGGAKLTPEFSAILIGLVLYTGAFIAEIVRAGILAVPRGQTEAARALGLSETQRLRLVVLPQALRVIIPPMTSQYLNLTKNSSLAQVVAFPDLWTVSYTTLNQSGRAIQVMLIVMGSYLAVSLAISALLNWYNQRIALVER
ncbi:MAG: ABC transporter permease subunit [Chloroflexota bacterium]